MKLGLRFYAVTEGDRVCGDVYSDRDSAEKHRAGLEPTIKPGTGIAVLTVTDFYQEGRATRDTDPAPPPGPFCTEDFEEGSADG